MSPVPQARGRLRVLMTTDTVGGVWVYSMELARALRREVDFYVASMGASATSAQAAEARAAGVHLVDSGYKLEWMESPWRDVREAGIWLRGLEAELQPDVVHLNQYAHGNLPWHTPVLMVGHSCVQSWWQAVYGVDAPVQYDLYRDVVAIGIQGADFVAAPSEWMFTTLRRLYGPLPKGHAVYNGRHAEAFRQQSVKAPVVFSAGRLWDRAKNIESLMAIADELPWRVVVAGPGVEKSGDSKNWVSLGPVAPSVVARWMRDSAIYALPARYEPFGLSVLEAALAGCALVLGDIPSLREIWGETAHYVPPDDADALKRAIRTLIEDERLREEYARRARIRASRYSITRMRDEYLGLYSQLAGAPSAAYRGL